MARMPDLPTSNRNYGVELPFPGLSTGLVWCLRSLRRAGIDEFWTMTTTSTEVERDKLQTNAEPVSRGSGEPLTLDDD